MPKKATKVEKATRSETSGSRKRTAPAEEPTPKQKSRKRVKNSEEKVSKKTTKRKATESPLAQNLFPSDVSPPKRAKKSPPKTTKSEKTRTKRQKKTNETAKEKPLPSLSVEPKKLSTKRKFSFKEILY